MILSKFIFHFSFLCVQKVPACREHLAKIFKELSLHKSPCVKQRTPSAPYILYLVAGFSRRSINLLEAFSVVDNKWVPLCPMPKSRSGLGGAFLGKQNSFHSMGVVSFLDFKDF